MGERILLRATRFVAAYAICIPALFMPYRARVTYIQALSAIAHAPFRSFGKLARMLLDGLNILAHESTAPVGFQKSELSAYADVMAESARSSGKVVVLFSGGTDSTCVAALMGRKFQEIHLLTYYEFATRKSPDPLENVRLLECHFADVRFIHERMSVDGIVRHLWYEHYFDNFKKHGLLVLSTCGFSSLSWHMKTITYCLEHGITDVVDGLTRELMHFPGHMDIVVERFCELYAAFGIQYANPVRSWPTPPDKQFIDKVIVNRHGDQYFLGGHIASQKTTGKYLFDIGMFESPDVKGSPRDFSMQHDCYPFGLYNILAFWGFLSVYSYSQFCGAVSAIMEDKTVYAKSLLEEYRNDASSARLTMMLS